jgi:hypothetical protein
MNEESKGRKEKFVPIESEQFITKYSDKRSRRKKLFQKLALAHFDVDSAYKTCELFLEKVAAGKLSEKTVEVGMGNPLYLPLLEAMIISYSRPFIDNDGLGVLSKQWSEFEDKELKKTHHFILNYRNDLVAHSDHTVRKIQIFSANANFGPMRKKQKMEGPGFAVSTFWIPLGRVGTFHRLFAVQGQRMIAEVMRMLDELYGEMDLPDKAFDLRDDEGL